MSEQELAKKLNQAYKNVNRTYPKRPWVVCVQFFLLFRRLFAVYPVFSRIEKFRQQNQ